MNNRFATGAVALVLAGLALAGCRGTTSSASSAVKSAGTSTVAAQAKVNYAPIIKQCGVSTAAGQLVFLKDLGSKTGRQAIWAKCGVPPQNRQAATDQALQAAEAGHLAAKGVQGKVNREQYFAVTLPKIVKANQA